MKRTAALAYTLALGLFGAEPAMAEEADATDGTSQIGVDLSVTATSDYRFRGVSLTDRDPALQAELAVAYDSGIYASFFISNIEDNGGADLETDVGIGYSRDIGPVTFDINAMYYIYPDAQANNYAEFSARLSTQAGPVEVGIAAAYAPAQNALGGEDNRYFSVDASLAIKNTPLSLAGSFGIEHGAFGSSKRDWSFGLNADFDRFTLGVSYYDTARSGGDPNGKASLVGWLTAKF